MEVFLLRSLLLTSAVLGMLILGTTASAQNPTDSLNVRLGYKASDKLLIIHADDVGMCHSVNAATIDAMEHGVVTCASIMMPCPWVPEIAAYCRAHPEADFGLHLTLTSEWQGYRWRPVTPLTEVPSLQDVDGYLPHEVPEVVAHGKPAEVAREIRSQIERAAHFGIKPTHVDSHMGTLFTAPFYAAYTTVSKEMGVMPMVLYPTAQRVQQAKLLGIDAMASYQDLNRQGYVFLDALYESAKGDTLEDRRKYYLDLFHTLRPGVNEIIVHLAMNDEEIKHISGAWEARWNEYQIFTDPKTRAVLNELGIKLIGYKQLKELAFKHQ